MFSERLSFRGSLWQAFVRAEVPHSPPAPRGDSSACPEPGDPVSWGWWQKWPLVVTARSLFKFKPTAGFLQTTVLSYHLSLRSINCPNKRRAEINQVKHLCEKGTKGAGAIE